MRNDLKIAANHIDMDEVLVKVWQDSLYSLAVIIEQQLQDLYKTGNGVVRQHTITLPDYYQYPENPLSGFIITNGLNKEEIVVLIIAMVNHLDPAFFDDVIQKNLSQPGDFPELGGTRGKNFR